jgi:hypothetical protein
MPVVQHDRRFETGRIECRVTADAFNGSHRAGVTMLCAFDTDDESRRCSRLEPPDQAAPRPQSEAISNRSLSSVPVVLD